MVGNLNTTFTLDDCLSGAAKLTKNAGPDKNGHISYGTGFDARSNFSIKGEWAKIVIIFSVYNSLSVHVDNIKKKDILVLGEESADG